MGAPIPGMYMEDGLVLQSDMPDTYFAFALFCRRQHKAVGEHFAPFW
jgi:hypothetical protein